MTQAQRIELANAIAISPAFGAIIAKRIIGESTLSIASHNQLVRIGFALNIR